MSPMSQVVHYAARLADDELHREATRLAVEEKRSGAKLIAHLAEISRRKLHSLWGYKGLYEYCLSLNIEPGQIPLRVQVANCCQRFPTVLDCLAENRMSLTVAAKLASKLTAENCTKLLQDCVGMTCNQVDEYLVALAPKPVVTSGVKKAPRKSSPAASADPLFSNPPESSSPPPRRGSIEPATPEVFNFRFAANRRLKDKITRLAEVLGVHDPSRNLAELIETAVDLALDKKDPRKKQERRRQREAKKGQSADTKVTSSRSNEIEPRPKKRTRSIPSRVRERVLERCDYRCEYISPQGRRCPQRTGIQIDHIVPYARNGSNDESNLRGLCPVHNRWAAEQIYGEEFIRAKIESRE